MKGIFSSVVARSGVEVESTVIEELGVQESRVMKSPADTPCWATSSPRYGLSRWGSLWLTNNRAFDEFIQELVEATAESSLPNSQLMKNITVDLDDLYSDPNSFWHSWASPKVSTLFGILTLSAHSLKQLNLTLPALDPMQIFSSTSNLLPTSIPYSCQSNVM